MWGLMLEWHAFVEGIRDHSLVFAHEHRFETTLGYRPIDSRFPGHFRSPVHTGNSPQKSFGLIQKGWRDDPASDPAQKWITPQVPTCLKNGLP